MWIAFIFQYLWDTQQLLQYAPHNSVCCELLSFFSIFEIHNNSIVANPRTQAVVNCFHFSVSLRYTTTVQMVKHLPHLLWIAFIFQYLWDTQQLIFYGIYLIYSCELLSFFSIFEIHNNKLAAVNLNGIVVNCFHFSVSLRYTTTAGRPLKKAISLWIAFIFQYLWDTQQPRSI